MLEQAIRVAQQALKGIYSETGEPYIEHAFRIMNQMDTETEKVVAILHDVVEDSQCTLSDLRALKFPREVIDCVDQLTRKNDMTYFEYIDDISTNDLCTKIKLAEIDDNKDYFRVRKLSFQTYSIDDRCKKAKDILLNR